MSKVAIIYYSNKQLAEAVAEGAAAASAEFHVRQIKKTAWEAACLGKRIADVSAKLRDK